MTERQQIVFMKLIDRLNLSKIPSDKALVQEAHEVLMSDWGWDISPENEE